MIRKTLFLVILILTGCGPAGHTQKVVRITPEAMAPYSDALGYDRATNGFTSLPTSGWMTVECVDRTNWSAGYPPPRYDIMLHFSDGHHGYRYEHRSIALKKVSGRFIWIGEQQSFQGPKTFTTCDGTLNESITLTAEIEQIAVQGTNILGTVVHYSGPDTRLVESGRLHAGILFGGDELSIAQVAPIIREWGYKYEIGISQPTNRPYLESAAQSPQR